MFYYIEPFGSIKSNIKDEIFHFKLKVIWLQMSKDFIWFGSKMCVILKALRHDFSSKFYNLIFSIATEIILMS